MPGKLSFPPHEAVKRADCAAMRILLADGANANALDRKRAP